MSKWLLCAAIVALVSPAVQAQTTAPTTQPMTDAGEVARGRYLVFFDFNKSTLTPAARQVISEAAADFRNSGQSQLQVVGHTDTSGSAAYNQRLSERRAASVQAELVRLGVPESAGGVGQAVARPAGGAGVGGRPDRQRQERPLGADGRPGARAAEPAGRDHRP